VVMDLYMNWLVDLWSLMPLFNNISVILWRSVWLVEGI
jgi:hypothetical protein